MEQSNSNCSGGQGLGNLVAGHAQAPGHLALGQAGGDPTADPLLAGLAQPQGDANDQKQRQQKESEESGHGFRGVGGAGFDAHVIIIQPGVEVWGPGAKILMFLNVWGLGLGPWGGPWAWGPGVGPGPGALGWAPGAKVTQTVRTKSNLYSGDLK